MYEDAGHIGIDGTVEEGLEGIRGSVDLGLLAQGWTFATQNCHPN